MPETGGRETESGSFAYIALAKRTPKGQFKEGVLAEERFSRGKFIKLGAALGVGAAGASLVAACGGGGGDEKASQGEGQTPGAVKGAEETTEGTSGVAQIESGEAIARESDLEPGSALEFTDEGTGQQ